MDKSKITSYLEENRMSSVMSDTRWRELFRGLIEIDGSISCRRKNLQEDYLDMERWDGDMYHSLAGWRYIEWLDIKADFVSIGDDKYSFDDSKELFEILDRTKTPYSLFDGNVRVWGYLRPGVQPEWEHNK